MGFLKQKRRVAAAITAVVAVGAVGVASSASSAASTSGTIKVNVGTGKPITYTKGEKLTVGFFVPDSSNGWAKAYIAAGEAEAKKLGVAVKLYDPNFSPTVQLQEIQDAISQHQINVASMESNDGVVTCKQVTQELPAANILVSVATVPACNTGTSQTGASPDQLWAKGTLNFVGTDNVLSWVVKWFDAAAKLNPGPQNVVLNLGQSTAGQTLVILKALKLWQKENPKSKFKVTGEIYTDYTATGSYTATLPYLQAHKTVSVMMVASAPDETQGAVKAIAQAGDTKKIKVDDEGGDPWSISAIKSGSVQMSMPLYPANDAKLSIESVVDAARGIKQPRYVDDSNIDGYNVNKPFVITKANVNKAGSLNQYGS